MVDQLASYYASQGQPAIFIEQYPGNPIGDRYSRFWAAFGGGTAYYPLVIADSGHQYTSGPMDYYNVWKGMIDAELARPAQAAITAEASRAGDTIVVAGKLTNLSGVALSSAANEAEISAIVYEDIHAGVTDRYVRAVASLSIASPLADGDTRSFTLQTAVLTGVDWSRLHTVVVVDYRPAGHTGAFDMLQAATPTPLIFTVTPTGLVFMIDAASPASAPQALHVATSASLPWTATSSSPWLSISPASGTGPANPAVSVDPGLLAPGWQTAYLSFAVTPTSGVPVKVGQVTVKTFVGDVERSYLPSTRR